MSALFRSILIVLSCACATVVSAQSIEQWIGWGDASMARQEYFGASRFYGGALALEPGRMSLQWKQAEACRLSNQYPQAIDLYQRVYQKDAGRTYPDALRWLGEMQLCDARYVEAEETWNKVLQKQKNKESTVAQRAQNAIAGCMLAQGTTPVEPFVVSHLPAPVNTNDSEFGARVGPEGELWFTSLRGDLKEDGEVKDTSNYKVAMYSSRPVSSGWSTPMAEEGPPDAMGASHANLMWTANGDRIYFTTITTDGTKHIATRTPNGPMQPVNGLDDHPNATQPWATVLDGKPTLFFVSDGGEGGTDIWLGDLIEALITNIRNAGTAVNSPGNESSPSYDLATNTLWFSSDHHAGLGGFDIFRSERSNGTFAEPKNVKALNSPANDLYPVFDGNTGKGWLTSNRKGSFAAKGETCCNDIYAFSGTAMIAHQDTVIVVHEGSIPATTASRNTPTEQLLLLSSDFPLKLYFHNDEPEPRTQLRTTRQSYGSTYDAYRRLFDQYRAEQHDAARIDAFFQNEVEAGRAKLDALTQALIPALEAGERITLDVRGHASPLAKNDYNRNLSLRRIESLRMHLRTAENRRLEPYLDSTATNGAVLRLRVLPFGEDRSATGVSDDRYDLKRSVYSVEAARERRIEVERIHLEQAAIPLGHSMRFSLGTVRQGVPQDFEIPVVNTGTTPLLITRGRSSCDCVLVRGTPPTIAPGTTGIIGLQYSGRTRPGELERLIELEIDGSNSPFQLTIHGTVIE